MTKKSTVSRRSFLTNAAVIGATAILLLFSVITAGCNKHEQKPQEDFCTCLNAENIDKTISLLNEWLSGLSNDLTDSQKLNALATWLKAQPCIYDATLRSEKNEIVISFDVNGISKSFVLEFTTSPPLKVSGIREYEEEKSIAVTGVELNHSMYKLSLDDSFTLAATVLPANAANQKVTWAIEEGGEAFVSIEPAPDGMSVTVTAIDFGGKATITVSTEDGGKKVQCVVIVPAPVAVTGVALSHSAHTLALNKDFILTATVLPLTAANQKVYWAIEAGGEAFISIEPANDGMSVTVTAIDFGGEAVITVTTEEGAKTAQCVVTAVYDVRMQMTMVTAKSGRVVIVLAGSGDAYIDWGDGSREDMLALSTVDKRVEHTYSSTTERTIAITGENITFLSCTDNELTELDVSHNTMLTTLWCIHNYRLTELDVSKNTALTTLECWFNGLRKLKLNNALTYLDCSRNLLTELDVSKNTALKFLNCNFNGLTELDVNKNTALTQLICGYNQLTELNVSKNTALKSLGCSNNQLTELDVSKNISLEGLSCSYNQLTVLNVKNTALKSFDCNNNQLTELDLSKHTTLTELRCYDNQITELDVSKNAALNDMNCDNNQLTVLNVRNTALTWLNCNNNRLTELDVSTNTSLTMLSCDFNQITVLDLSKNIALKSLNCYKNQLTELDVSKNTALISLYCTYNQLTELDVSACIALEDVSCRSNKLSAVALNRLFVSLHDNDIFRKTVYIGGNDGVANCDPSIATAKKWKVDTSTPQ